MITQLHVGTLEHLFAAHPRLLDFGVHAQLERLHPELFRPQHGAPEELPVDADLALHAVGAADQRNGVFAIHVRGAERHRPPELTDANPENLAFMERTRNAMKAGRLSAADVARITLEAVRAGHFYVLPHRNALPGVEARMRDLLDGRAPNNPLPKA